jgi:hypothetical protein
MEVPLLGQPRPVPPTIHKTTFHGCEVGFYAVLNEENVCIEYKLVIIDPREAHTYELGFDQELRDTFHKDLGQFPDVGTVPPVMEEVIQDGDGKNSNESRDAGEVE